VLSAPIPANEPSRLAALRQLLLLDTPPEQRFDKLVAFAASEFDVPIVLFSLVEHDRQWFKAKVGIQACSTGRDVSFCAHAILQPALFIVPDATVDERFADNPLVTGAPHIRFYAGAPLILPTGEAIGTLCLIDTQPRQLDEIDQLMLGTVRDLLLEEMLAQSAMAQDTTAAEDL
jgi:GAF domain-containing protein